MSASLGSLQATRAVPSGTYADFRLKLGPFISSVVPLQQNTTALIVTSGGSITINGYGFGQQCSGCQVLAASAGSTTYYLLPVSSWSDGAISASFLPATMPNLVVPGLVIIYVELSSSAWDSIDVYKRQGSGRLSCSRGAAGAGSNAQQFFHAADNLRRRDLQRHRDSYHGANCWAVDPALDEADVRPVKPAFQRQLFLRNLLAFASLSKGLSERFLRAGLRLNLLAPMIARCLRQ